MKIYHYHKHTREFLKKGVADPDPLRPGEFILPAHCTDIEPPVTRQNEVAVFDVPSQTWTVRRDKRGQKYFRKETGEEVVIENIGDDIPADAVMSYAETTPALTVSESKILREAELAQAKLDFENAKNVQDLKAALSVILNLK